MSTSESCKDSASKLNDDDVCEVDNMLQNMSTVNNEVNILSVCANCGKEGDDVNNICNKCMTVKYCNAACKKKHRHKHNKECEEHIRLVAERAAKLHDIELFKQPPPQYGDCPICFIQIPTLITGWRYNACCGKVICSGCFYAPLYDDQGNEVDNEKCPFCRRPTPDTDEEIVRRLKKRVDAGEAYAIYYMGCHYENGTYGFAQDHVKSLELFQRAGELGHAAAYTNIGASYHNGEGVEVDKKKSIHYFELAAMKGNMLARHNLGIMEKTAGNMDRALNHYMIATKGGNSDSLKQIKAFYSNGHATKDDYTKALQLYQSYLGEIKSVQRDEAAAAYEEFRYY